MSDVVLLHRLCRLHQLPFILPVRLLEHGFVIAVIIPQRLEKQVFMLRQLRPGPHQRLDANVGADAGDPFILHPSGAFSKETSPGRRGGREYQRMTYRRVLQKQSLPFSISVPGVEPRCYMSAAHADKNGEGCSCLLRDIGVEPEK